MDKYGWVDHVDRLLPVVPDLVNLGLYTIWSLQCGESIMFSHSVSVQTCFKHVNGLDIKNDIRQPISSHQWLLR